MTQYQDLVNVNGEIRTLKQVLDILRLISWLRI